MECLIFFYLYLPVLVEKERSSYILRFFFFSNYRFKKFRFTDYNHGDP